MKIINGFAAARAALSREIPSFDFQVSEGLRRDLKQLFGVDMPEAAVRLIIEEVRAKGDAALLDLTMKIDGIPLKSLEVSKKEIKAAYGEVDGGLVEALKTAAERVYVFHGAQKESIWHEVSESGLSQLIRPLRRAGVYVPGGTASYPSTVLMTAVPARVAGVEEIIMVTPPGRDGRIPPATLVAADIAGVDRIFNVGGAQAIAALAFGTESVPAVDKICGPGNIFVTLAKKAVYGSVDIDGLQGPSEVLIIADDEVNVEYCAAEMLAQAEHDPLAASVLIITSAEAAGKIQREIEGQLSRTARKDIAARSLENSTIAVVTDLDEAIALSNLYAPEHLCLMFDGADSYIDKVHNAGCVFTGRYATVVLGDYVAGPSHALPTGGTARFSSPLNVCDFIKFISVVGVDEAGIKHLGRVAAVIARAEGLEAHARSVERRIRGLEQEKDSHA